MITPKDIELCEKVFRISGNSNANKRKVGAIIYDETTEKKLIHGYNTRYEENLDCENSDGETFEDVIHAEEYAIMQALTNNVNINGKTLYCTYSPCMNCCKLIIQSGIKRVVYVNQHKTNFTEPAVKGGLAPIDFLKKYKVNVERCEQLVHLNQHEKENAIIVHHDTDNDGKMSGWLLSRIYPDAKRFGYNYQKHSKWMDEKDVTTYIFGDITPHLDWVKNNIERIHLGEIKVIIYDHHADRKKQIDVVDVDSDIYWDYVHNIGACEIILQSHSTTLRQMCDEKDMNFNILKKICYYLALYDVWAFTKPQYKHILNEILGFDIYMKDNGFAYNDFEMEINRCLALKNHFINLMSNHRLEILKDKVLRSNMGMIQKGMYYGTEVCDVFLFQGHLKNYWIENQIHEYCMDRFGKEPDFLISYNIRLEEGIITFSLRSRTLSALKLAKHIAGDNAGGHPNASGMSLPLNVGFEFIKYVSNHIDNIFVDDGELVEDVLSL